MSRKTHMTAVVIIPPEGFWAPIQAIRRKHDRGFRRWMPHITMIYPFLPRAEFEHLLPEFDARLASSFPFDLQLREIRYFRHHRDHFTLWLAPDPPEPLVRLQQTLQTVVPECDDLQRFKHGFTPHLSIAQARGKEKLATLQASLEREWQPLTFTVQMVSLIWRGDPPEDVFQVSHTLPL